MNDIAAQAGVAKATLYNHFRTKDDVWSALVEAEVRALAGRPGGLSRTAAQAIGYKELLAHLDGEIATPSEAFDLAVSRTRRFARRQRVWFRRDPRIQWVGTARNPHDLAAVVLTLWSNAATVAADRA